MTIKLCKKILENLSKVVNDRFSEATPAPSKPLQELNDLEHSRRTIEGAAKLTETSYDHVNSQISKIKQFQAKHNDATTATQDANQISIDACKLTIDTNDLIIAIAIANNLKGFAHSTATSNIIAKNNLRKLEKQTGLGADGLDLRCTKDNIQGEIDIHANMDLA